MIARIELELLDFARRKSAPVEIERVDSRSVV
jgi:hypothetical protein